MPDEEVYCTVKPDEVPPVPDNKFLKRRVPVAQEDVSDLKRGEEEGEIALDKSNRGGKDRDRDRDRNRDRDRDWDRSNRHNNDRDRDRER